MKSTDEINKGLERLDKMQFFMGQRAGRELWNDKPRDVQESDLEQYNRDAETVRSLIQQLEEQNAEQAERIRQLEAERDAAVEDMASIFGCLCNVCKDYEKGASEAPCNSCRMIRKGEHLHFAWRGAQKEE